MTSEAILKYFPDQHEFTDDELNGQGTSCEIDGNGAQYEPEQDSCDLEGVTFTDIHANAGGDRGCNEVPCYRNAGFTLPDGTVIDAADDNRCFEYNVCDVGSLGGSKMCGFQCIFE